MTAAVSGPGAVKTPGLARRLACFLYEGVLLFGVVMAAGLVYAIATNQRHALVGTLGMRIVVFLVLGLYFVWFWSRQGQTLAQRTWRMQLVAHDGRPPGPWRALARYLLSWLWFMPALLALQISGLKGTAAAMAALIAGVLVYAALSLLNPARQYLHDLACGTRLIDWHPAPQQPAR
jgi:uncharacterized RDD family membrane protein YckC